MRVILFLLFILSAVATAQEVPVAPESARRAIIIELEGTVDKGMASYVKRALEQALQQKPDAIVFQVNSFGGRLDAAMEISDMLMAVQDVETVAFVHEKAISAGALISLSASKLFMMPGTTIGDCAPVIQGAEGPKIIGEKVQTVLRAKFRTLAQRHNYPELLCEAMVTDSLEIVEAGGKLMHAYEYEELSEEEQKQLGSKKTLVRKGELLTLTDIEAHKFGFSRQTCNKVEDVLEALNIEKFEKLEITWSEDLARGIEVVTPILMLIGFGALYMELKTPGFGFFGIIGIVCLMIVFGGEYVAGLAGHMALSFFVIGAVLMVVEMLFFPGTFIAGGFAVMCFITSLVLVTAPNMPTETEQWSALGRHFLEGAAHIFIIAGLAVIIPIFLTRYLMPRIPARYSVILDADLSEAYAPVIDGYGQLKEGDEGESLTMLRPMGKVRFASGVMEVSSLDPCIEKGQKVKVIKCENLNIWVREVRDV